VRGLGTAAAVLAALSLIVFLLLRLAPGDPAAVIAGVNASPDYVEQVRRELRLDRPLHVQYLAWITRISTGDLGRSAATGRAVFHEVVPRLRATFLLGVLGTAIAVIIGLSIGLYSATHRNTLADTVGLLMVLAGVSTPSFVLALVLVLLFAVHLGWLPATGGGATANLVLPALSLGVYHSAFLARITRTVMIDVLGHDYIRTARAKGLSESRVIVKHGFRNGLVVIMTVIGLELGRVITGTVFVESVFAYPGLGSLMVDSILARDIPLVQGAVLSVGAVYVLVNLFTDFLCRLVDPRTAVS
jgi:ABC-type dipeptide/oligopeptide/nickel transport system permease component